MRTWLRLILGAACLGVVLIGVTGTQAWFTDTARIEGLTFISGSLDIHAELVDGQCGGLDENGHCHCWRYGQESSEYSLVPGGHITFCLRVWTTGDLPVTYTVDPTLSGDLAMGATPCTVTDIRIDGMSSADGTLGPAGDADDQDIVEIDVSMPWEAGSEYQGQGGELVVTIDAGQQRDE